MIENIDGIKIKGGYFEEECILRPFAQSSEGDKSKPKYVSLIYGKNGSGKTSLAKAFYEVSKGKNEFSTLEIIDHNNKVITNDIDKQNIFVFDEHYIKRKIEFGSDGLDSVVMLGEQVELDKQIKQLEAKKKTLSAKINTEESSYEATYGTPTNLLAPEYHFNAIKKNLQQNWSVRESDIKNMRQNAPVRDEFITSLFNNDEHISIDKVRTEFDDVLSKLKSAQSGERIDKKIEKIVEDTETENKIVSLLNEKINKPVLSDREQLIMQIVNGNSDNEKRILDSKEFFSNSAISRCPFCLQPVDAEYKESLLSSIAKIFDTDEANCHKNELSSVKIDIVSIDLHQFRIIDNDLCDSIQQLVENYKQLVISVRQKIKQKIDSVYSPVTCDKLGLVNLQEQINQQIGLLSEAIVKHNENIASVEKLKAKLINLNKAYAREEVRSIYLQYKNQLKEAQEKKAELDGKRKELLIMNESIEELNARKNNIHIAIEIINGYLAYIFFEKDRLKLEQNAGKYIVKCRGNRVQLKSLSMGERNVIALCYFLSVLFHGKLKTDIYNNECLLILDDPISSFDFDNKIGMYSFLRYIFDKIHTGNKQSRCLLLTHEIEAMFNVIKICDDIKIHRVAYELKDKKMVPFHARRYNEYSFMLRHIFSFANMEKGYNEFVESIGNIMRRALEAYGTFIYKKGIDDLSSDDEILSMIQNAKKRDYFNNLMYRLVLNGESHLQERAQGLPDTDFFVYISEAEKVRTAKEILIFINILTPLHLKTHLRESPSDDITDKLNKIQAWENDIFVE